MRAGEAGMSLTMDVVAESLEQQVLVCTSEITQPTVEEIFYG
jgi:hypothetical protein